MRRRRNRRTRILVGDDRIPGRRQAARWQATRRRLNASASASQERTHIELGCSARVGDKGHDALVVGVHVIRHEEEESSTQSRIRHYLLKLIALPGIVITVVSFVFGFFVKEVAMQGAYNEAYQEASNTIIEITSKAAAGRWFDELTVVAAKQARKGFTIPGVGKLVVVKRKSRKGRNFKTGELIKIRSKNVLQFRVAKTCRDKVFGKK